MGSRKSPVRVAGARADEIQGDLNKQETTDHEGDPEKPPVESDVQPVGRTSEADSGANQQNGTGEDRPSNESPHPPRGERWTQWIVTTLLGIAGVVWLALYTQSSRDQVVELRRSIVVSDRAWLKAALDSPRLRFYDETSDGTIKQKVEFSVQLSVTNVGRTVALSVEQVVEVVPWEDKLSVLIQTQERHRDIFEKSQPAIVGTGAVFPGDPPMVFNTGHIFERSAIEPVRRDPADVRNGRFKAAVVVCVAYRLPGAPEVHVTQSVYLLRAPLFDKSDPTGNQLLRIGMDYDKLILQDFGMTKAS